jgi:glycosyltransferase involved in cell wall biosynthesis
VLVDERKLQRDDNSPGPRLKIVYFSLIDLGRSDGARTHTMEMLRALGEAGHEVRAILPGAPRDLALPDPVRVQWIRPPAKKLSSLLATYRQVSRELRNLARDFQPDIYYERECAFDPFLWRTARRLHWPSVIEINGLVTEELRLHGSSWRGVLLASLLQSGKCRAARLLVCGAAGWADWLERAYRLPAHRAVFIPNGVFPGPFLTADRSITRAKLGFSSDMFVVGFVGSFNRYADLETVIHGINLAHRREPRVMGYLVGGGLQRAECAALVRDLGAEKFVRFGNPVSHQEVPMQMAALDCAVAPMVRAWLEQMGCWHASTKVAEYLAAGLPILAFDLPGSKSQEVMAEVSLMVPPADSEALAASILLLAEDRRRWQCMSAAARGMAVQQRSWDRTVQAIMEALQQAPRTTGPRAG